MKLSVAKPSNIKLDAITGKKQVPYRPRQRHDVCANIFLLVINDVMYDGEVYFELVNGALLLERRRDI